jgi:hypothetical protein
MNSNTIVSLTCAGVLAACASGGAPAPAASAADVPPLLKPADTEVQAFSFAARGVQIYQCKSAAGAAPAWAFVAPEAELFDASGTKAGTHGAGPFWQHLDGSKVIGTLRQRADAPASGDIPWLLLGAKSVGGPGTLAMVTSVQRIHTRGGVAPSQGCAGSGDLGAEARVPYTADYVFFLGR